MMQNNTLNITVVSFSPNHIDTSVTKVENDRKWRATGIFGYLEGAMKLQTCELIHTLAHILQDLWACFGDFNLVLSLEEKRLKCGGNPPNQSHIDAFQEVRDDVAYWR